MENNSAKTGGSVKNNESQQFVVDEILRDLQQTQSQKETKSHQFFKGTKVSSSKYVVVKNGVAQAIPFRATKKQEEGPKQAYTTSLAQ
jgi:hypothetical protein